ncbi:hypothetical protein JHW43_006514 [Diplocarpon mali]|nr:hypothetical protein JHW43_006514 [Diplocarpon mali]
MVLEPAFPVGTYLSLKTIDTSSTTPPMSDRPGSNMPETSPVPADPPISEETTPIPPAPAPIKKIARKGKWRQDQGPVIGLARRKGERNPLKWGFQFDDEWLGHAVWKDCEDLPALAKQEGENAAPAGSKKSKRGIMGMLTFWKRKEEVLTSE